jgi:hypothetical protein
MQKTLATTTADISWPMNWAGSPPVAPAYICDMGTAPSPRPPAMIGAAMNRIPSTKPNPTTRPSSPISRNVAARQPTSGMANRGPALISSARGIPRMLPAMIVMTRKSRKPMSSTNGCTTAAAVSGIKPKKIRTAGANVHRIVGRPKSRTTGTSVPIQKSRPPRSIVTANPESIDTGRWSVSAATRTTAARTR